VNRLRSGGNIELAFDSVPDVRLSQDRAAALVRIASEARTNAARHSRTTVVRLTLTRDGQRVRLRVSDADCGFNPDATGVASASPRSGNVPARRAASCGSRRSPAVAAR
jgi:signal transduction histidine kinase